MSLASQLGLVTVFLTFQIKLKRSYRVNTNYLGDKRYISFSNFIKTRSIFGMDFIFDEVPHKLDLFDYDTFFKSPCEFKLGVTDVETGKPVYFDKTALDHDCTVLKASSSIPVFSPIVEYKREKIFRRRNI